jgi:hypothetical protein
MDVASFREHWRNNHAPLAAAIIKKYMSTPLLGATYVQNRVEETLWQKDFEGSVHRVDGIAQFEVNPADPPPEARASGELNTVLEDEKRFLGIWTQCIVEAEGDDSPRDSSSKIIAVLERSPAASKEAFSRGIRGLLADGRDEVSQLCLNWIRAAMSRQGLDHEPVEPDLIVEAWFDSKDSVRKALLSSGGLERVAPLFHRASVYLVRPDRII